MKLSWPLTSILIGIIGGLLTFLLTRNWKISLLAGVLISIVMLLNNPKRRYMKAFWAILSLILVLNKFFFEIMGQVSAVHFKVGSDEIGSAATVFLIVLAGIALILDYLERNGKLQGTFLEFNSNKIGNISGNNITINQNIKNNPNSNAE